MSNSGLNRKESSRELRHLLTLDQVVAVQGRLFLRSGQKSLARAALTAGEILLNEELPLIDRITGRKTL